MIDNNNDVCFGQYGELVTGPSTVAMKESMALWPSLAGPDQRRQWHCGRVWPGQTGERAGLGHCGRGYCILLPKRCCFVIVGVRRIFEE